jgi:hypothetical protein
MSEFFYGPRLRRRWGIFPPSRDDARFKQDVLAARALFNTGIREILIDRKRSIKIDLREEISPDGRKYESLEVCLSERSPSDQANNSTVLRYEDKFYDEPDTWRYAGGDWSKKLREEYKKIEERRREEG